MPPAAATAFSSGLADKSNFAINTMENIIDRFFEKNDIFPTTKADALELLDALKSSVIQMNDFTVFPQGANGVVLYALLERSSNSCADVGDFNYIYQNYQSVLETAFKSIKEDVFEK